MGPRRAPTGSSAAASAAPGIAPPAAMATGLLKTPFLALAIGLCLAGNAFATNGYFTHGNGTKNKAMAGAGIALPEDSIDVTNNPAVAPFVGDQLIFGASVFSPIRKYETSSSMANGGCFPGMGCAFTIGPNKLKSKSNNSYSNRLLTL